MYVYMYIYIKKRFEGFEGKNNINITSFEIIDKYVSKSMISSSMSYVKRNERSMCKLLLQIKFKFTN